MKLVTADGSEFRAEDFPAAQGMARATIDGVAYLATCRLEIRGGSGGTQITSPDHPIEEVPDSRCDSCHRFDVREPVLRTWEEAFERGWLIKVIDE